MTKKLIPLFLTLLSLTPQLAVSQTPPSPTTDQTSSALPPSRSLPTAAFPASTLPTSELPKTSSSKLNSLTHYLNNETGTPGSATTPTPTATPTIPNFPGLQKNNGVSVAAPSLPTLPTLPTSPLNPAPSSPIWLDPHQNNALPVEIESQIAHLLVLEDTPIVVDGSTPFAVVAKVYTSLLNLFATDDATQQIMYTDSVKPYIEKHVDEKGNYSYTTVSGAENTLLGYSHCLSATRFRDVLCTDQNTLFTLDANVDSNQQTYFWVHFTTLFLTPEDNSENEMTHYQWIYGAGIGGDYYDFYLTKDHPDLSKYTQISPNLCLKSLTGNIWVGSRDDSNLNHDWTVTGNKFIGLSTSSDGQAFIQEPQDPADSASPVKQPEPGEPSNNSNEPTNPDATKSHKSSWEAFQENGAGSSWEAYLHSNSGESTNAKNSATPTPRTATSPSPTSSENNSSSGTPTLDKETEARIKLAAELHQQGVPIDQIATKTGFTEEQLKEIFSKLSQ